MPQRRRLLIIALVCGLVIAACVALSARESSSEPSGVVAPTADNTEAQRLSEPAVDLWAGIEEAIVHQEILDYVTAVEEARVIAYIEAVEEAQHREAAAAAERERQREAAAAEAARKKQAAASQPAPAVSSGSGVWWDLAGCETGYKYDNPNTGNGYYGYFQFDLQTWQSVGGPGYPHHHGYDTQLVYAKKLQAQRGWSPWPYCSKKLGLRS